MGNLIESENTFEAVEAVNEGITPAITISVIGVTDNVDQTELEAIASSSGLIYSLDSLQNTAAFSQIMGQQTYRICFIGE